MEVFNKLRGEIEMREKENALPVILCERGQSVDEAAEAHGYSKPLCRVGVVAHAAAGDGEILVATVRVGKYSLSLPVFRREIAIERGGDTQWRRKKL